MIKTVTWVKDGPYRKKILLLLKQRSYLPSELAIQLNINRASISRILKHLKEKKLVDFVKSSSRTSSYSLTDLGTKLLKLLENGK